MEFALGSLNPVVIRTDLMKFAFGCLNQGVIRTDLMEFAFGCLNQGVIRTGLDGIRLWLSKSRGDSDRT
jgi:hypothetical protein